MPPRKESKEPIHYPASKRKAPPFKPLRPSKVPRVSSADSEGSAKTDSAAADRRSSAPGDTRPAKAIAISDSEDDNDGAAFDSLTNNLQDDGDEEDSDEVLAENPLATKRRSSKAIVTTTTSRSVSKPVRDKQDMRQPSLASAPPRAARTAPPTAAGPSPETPSLPALPDGAHSISQSLVLRLLYEHFTSKDTKIDTHAVQVVQKYVEIFVRETVARTVQLKRNMARTGDVDELEAGWLELADLEKVAPGMLLDF